MRARRSALVVVICVGAAMAIGLGQATFAGADPQGPPPPDQRGQSVEHRPVCAPPPRGEVRCHSILVIRTNAKRPRPTTTTGAPTTTIAPTTTTAAPTTTTIAPTTTTAAPTTTTTAAPTTTTTAATTTTTTPATCTAAHAGYTPCDLQAAYKLPSSTAGGGQTVAIVDAFDAPNVVNDLATYRSAYGLPACPTTNGCFRKVNQTGGSTPPAADGGWAQEISLDVDMVSATCPNCKILLVEANSASVGDLAASVRTAAALGANAISNSYGISESQFILGAPDDSAYNQPGRAVTVSSGDGGYGVEFPASSAHVTAVGGTALTKAGNARGWSETAWSGAGSGCSQFFAKPSWQHDSGCSARMVADVSAVADPNTGVAVYDSYAYQGQSGWLEFGGTSVAAPIVASVYALAGNAGTIGPSFPYSHTSSLFDVTSGSNGTCLLSPAYFCNAVTGYDGPTGLGTPNTAGAF